MDYEFSKSFAETLRAGQSLRRSTTKSHHATQAPHAPVSAEQYRLSKTTPLATSRPGVNSQIPMLQPKQDSANQALLFTARPDFASRLNELKTLSNRASLSGPAFNHTHGYSYTNSSSLCAAGQESQRRRSVLGKTNRLKQWEAAKQLSEVVPPAGSPDAYRDPRGVMNNSLVQSHSLDTWRDHLVREGFKDQNQDATEPEGSQSNQSDASGGANTLLASNQSQSASNVDGTDVMPFDMVSSNESVKPRTLRKIVNMPWCNRSNSVNTPLSSSPSSHISAEGRHFKSNSSPAWWPQQPEKDQTNSNGNVARAEPTDEDLLAVRKATAVLAKELGNLNTRSWFRSIPPPASCSSIPCTITLPQFLETLPDLGLKLTSMQTDLLASMFFSRKSRATTDGGEGAENGDQETAISKPLEFNHLVSRIRTDQPYIPHITKYSAMMGHIADRADRRRTNWPSYSHEQAIELLKEHLLPRKTRDAKALGLGQRTSYKHVSNALSLLNIRLADGELDKLVHKLDTSGSGHINIADILSSESELLSHRHRDKLQKNSVKSNKQKGLAEDDFEAQRRMIDPASKFRLASEPKTRSTEPAQRAQFASDADRQVRGEKESVWCPGPVPTRFGRTYEGRMNSARVIAPGLDSSIAHLPFAKADQIKSETGSHMDVTEITDRYKPRDQAIADMQAEDRAQRKQRQDRIVQAKQAYEQEVTSLCEKRAEASAARSEGRRLGLIATRLQFCEALEQRTSYSSALDT